MARRSSENSVWLMVVAFIVLGALSLGAGYMGGRYLLRGFTGDPPTVTAPPQQIEGDDEESTPPVEENGDAEEAPNGEEVDDSEDEETSPTESVLLRGREIPLYRVQAGVFGVADYAELLRDELREEGVPAVIIPTADGSHRVLVDLLGTEASARLLMNQLEERGFEAIFSAWSLPPFEHRTEAFPDDHEAVQRLFELLEDLIRMQSDVEPGSEASIANLRPVIDEFGALREGLRGNLSVAVEQFLDTHADQHLMELRTAPARAARESYMNFSWAMAEFRGSNGG